MLIMTFKDGEFAQMSKVNVQQGNFPCLLSMRKVEIAKVEQSSIIKLNEVPFALLRQDFKVGFEAMT